MKEFMTNDIRNCAIVGHATVGKTTLSDAILFTAKEVSRLGSVDDGSTTSDYNQDEIERKISISAAPMHCSWNECKMNILDTPGYSDFVGEVIGCLRVAELGIVVINTVSGVEVGTESVWKIANQYGTSKLIFMNRLDKEHTNFDMALSTAHERFEHKTLALQIPVNPGEEFDSFIDLLKMQLVKYERNGSGKFSTSEIPAEWQAKADELREKLVERAAESDDELLEKFFEEGTLTTEEIKKGLKAGIANDSICPVLCGAAASNIGVVHLMDVISEFCPSPADHAAEKAKAVNSEEEVL
ncbi:GTP-binding protein, partial [bacterium]|nr:GTP-binding protein [bacterium]